MRHSSLQSGRQTLLFLHGLGDSSLSYVPYLHTPILSNYNILLPDLLGYGDNLKTNDYSFTHQVEDIITQIHTLEKKEKITFNYVILIAHSMGAIHAMLLCQSQMRDRIKGCINVEGTITQYGSFISEKVVNENKSGNFSAWYKNFVTTIEHSDHLYYQSLKLCDQNAFLQNAEEMQQYCHGGKGKYTNIAGDMFIALAIPKIYCYGDKSLCPESINFLSENHLPTKIFHTNSHFVMQRCFDDFSAYINTWIKQHFATS